MRFKGFRVEGPYHLCVVLVNLIFLRGIDPIHNKIGIKSNQIKSNAMQKVYPPCVRECFVLVNVCLHSMKNMKEKIQNDGRMQMASETPLLDTFILIFGFCYCTFIK